MRWMGVVVLVACSSSSPRVDKPATPSGKAVDPAATLATKSEAITMTVGARSVPGTIVAPADPGPWPAVVLLAGSGPTDRDWNSQLIASKNGSGKLLAEALAAHGAVVIRFDKAGSGQNAGPPLPEWTFDTYRDESVAALAALRARPDVRKDKVYIAGHSEGGIHATRLAAVSGAGVAGVIYLASASRSMADTMITQIEASMRNPIAGLSKDFVDADIASLRATLNDFLAGKTVDPAKASALPPVQQLVAGIVAPETAGLTRGLLGFDNAKEAPKVVTVPVLIVNGGKDIQVDPEIDAKPLHAAFVAAKRDATLTIVPDADHVLKNEPRTVVQIRSNLKAAQDGYNADGRVLDATLTASILTWLADRTR